jgi:hypothetical protein
VCLHIHTHYTYIAGSGEGKKNKIEGVKKDNGRQAGRKGIKEGREDSKMR